jgi:hypothetical protein
VHHKHRLSLELVCGDQENALSTDYADYTDFLERKRSLLN